MIPPAAARHPIGKRIARLMSCCVAAALIWSCGPVYIPVPPPQPGPTAFTSELVTDAAGNSKQVWIAAGGPDPLAGNATFYVFNQERNAGVISRALPDGTYQAPPMDGAEGDHVLIYYKDTRGEDSSVNCVLLSTLLPAAAVCPP